MSSALGLVTPAIAPPPAQIDCRNPARSVTRGRP